MPEPLESELAGIMLEIDVLHQEDFPPGDLRRRPLAIHILVKLRLCLHQGSLKYLARILLISSSRQATVRPRSLPCRVALKLHLR
jgi:hypothetical protein